MISHNYAGRTHVSPPRDKYVVLRASEAPQLRGIHLFCLSASNNSSKPSCEIFQGILQGLRPSLPRSAWRPNCVFLCSPVVLHCVFHCNFQLEYAGSCGYDWYNYYPGNYPCTFSYLVPSCSFHAHILRLPGFENPCSSGLP